MAVFESAGGAGGSCGWVMLRALGCECGGAEVAGSGWWGGLAGKGVDEAGGLPVPAAVGRGTVVKSGMVVKSGQVEKGGPVEKSGPGREVSS
ncbi:hypothetical protein GCM10010399_05590 [Dactylosporangium fulvum]